MHEGAKGVEEKKIKNNTYVDHEFEILQSEKSLEVRYVINVSSYTHFYVQGVQVNSENV